jgi:hypothetical protein
MDQTFLYDIMYALAAKDGREAALFGSCAPAAREAFSRSLTGKSFPELWFELPLAGAPWLDFHALVSHEDVAGTEARFSGHGGAYADALSWFSSQPPRAVRQLALSYDTSAGDVDHPAVQLLVNGDDVAVPIGFLKAVGRPDAGDSYQAFVHRIPSDWYACYVGVFPRRETSGAAPWVRVECIVGDRCQRAYADDAGLLRNHLARIGLEGVGEAAIEGIQELGIRDWLFEGEHHRYDQFWKGAMLLLGLPLFVACIIPTALMFIVPALLIKRFIKDQMFHSSINLGATAFITYPICCIIPSIVMICTGGWLRGLIYFALFPLMFIYAWNYVRWVTKAMGHRRFVLSRNRQKVEQLRALRSQIFGDLDEVLRKGTAAAE